MPGRHHEISQLPAGDVAFSNPKDSQLQQIVTLGSVRLHDANTGNMNLIPQPSEDPKDPLRWLVSSHLVHKKSVHTRMDTQVTSVQNICCWRHVPILDSGQLLRSWPCGSAAGSCRGSLSGDPTRSYKPSVSFSSIDLNLQIKHQESSVDVFDGVPCRRSLQSLLGSAGSQLWSSCGEYRFLPHVQFLLHMGSER